MCTEKSFVVDFFQTKVHFIFCMFFKYILFEMDCTEESFIVDFFQDQSAPHLHDFLNEFLGQC